MRVGFCLPQFGRLATGPGDIVRFARQAEQLGAASLWVGDRLLAPVRPVIGYGGTDVMPEEFRVSMDPFAVLAAAAAVTERPLLGSSVLNAPWYPPALLARSLATIHQLSGGRLLPGLGVGWSPDEYQAVDVAMSERGRRLDECLDVLDAFWNEQQPYVHSGRHWRIPASVNDLRPLPRPRIYLGGYTDAARRRVARHADGWLPVAYIGRFSPEMLRDTLVDLDRMVEAEGRDPAGVDAILRVNPAAGADLDRIVAAIIAGHDIAGVEHAYVDLMYVATTVDHALELAAQILDRLGL